MNNFIFMCPNCLADKQTAKQCPSCGYEETLSQQNPLYIKPRTILNQRYLIGNVIGHGGFGITYISWDIKLKRKIAIKEFLPTTLATRIEKNEGDNTRYTVTHTGNQAQAFQLGLKKFLKEARILAGFAHENIVRVIDYFESNNTGYIVMEYVGEEDLSKLIKQRSDKRLSVEEALEIFLPILNALKVVHVAGIYHQDISLQNIRMVAGKKPVLIDFGAARFIVGEVSQSLDKIFKPGYSPVEQITSSGKIGPWTDIYACGAVLYAMIVGELPPQSLDRLEQDDLIPPLEKGVKISSSVNNVVLKALSVRIGDRFQTADEFEQALRVKNLNPISTIPKKRLLVVGGGVFFAAAMAVGVGVANFNTPLKNNPAPSQPQVEREEDQALKQAEMEAEIEKLKQARFKAEQEARMAREARFKAEQEAKMEAEIEKLKQARFKAEQEARMAREARFKAEQEARMASEEKARREAENRRQQAPVDLVREYYEDINRGDADSVVSKWKSPNEKKLRSIVTGKSQCKINEIGLKNLYLNQAQVSIDVTCRQRWAGTFELEKVWGEWKITKIKLSASEKTVRHDREAENRHQQAPVDLVREYYEDINRGDANSVVSKWKSPNEKKLRSIVTGNSQCKINAIGLKNLYSNQAQVSIDVTCRRRWAGTVELEKVWGKWKITKQNLSEK